MENKTIGATGRRKEASARVQIKEGKGKVTVNGKEVLEYLKRQTLVDHVQKPLVDNDLMGNFDVICKAKGGGLTGQAGAIRLGLARALILRDPSLRSVLKKAGFLTRDAREVERKKYGQPKARKRFQFSKR
ncbi:MAG: 30S ribosomal protein S9 [Candidatus Zixiibacteriota bacterium]|nr:MAG: 30S ribosomal protein S9 [candidate division Zixibacteria bacterium]